MVDKIYNFVMEKNKKQKNNQFIMLRYRQQIVEEVVYAGQY